MFRILWLLLLPAAFCLSRDRLSGASFATRSEVIAVNGMACTSQPLATQAAVDILKSGGNAVDAAIAANAVNGVVEPMSCGIGGDLFAMVWIEADKKLYGLNASGRSPEDLTLQMLRERGLDKLTVRGPLPITVPGCVHGWFELHKRFGTLPMETILAHAVFYAQKGFPVTEIIAAYWQEAAESVREQPGFGSIYLPEGKAPAKGELFRNKPLSDLLEKIGQEGVDAFYKGKIGGRIAEFVQKHGGYISRKDLASHRSAWIEPVSTHYRGYDVWELPPNGQGIAVLQMLNILESYDIASMGFGSPDYLHLLIEAKKLVYEDRAKYYADPDFNSIPVKGLISKAYADKRRQLIDKSRAAAAYQAGMPDDGDTIYLTVADKDGNMVSLIQSIYDKFGSGITIPDLGFCLQNRGELFALEDGHVNQYAPGKRSFHTIIPAFVTRAGDPYMSFGVMGGAMQPQGQVQVLINHIDFGMNLQEAGDAPRVRHGGSSQPTGSEMNDGGVVYFESGFTPETIRALVKRGHKMQKRRGGFGGYQAILRNSRGIFFGASESRKDGQAVGY